MKRGLIILLVLALIAGGIVGFLAVNSLGISTGRCLIANDGSVMLVKEDYGPIVISHTGNEWMFRGLSTGDLILVAHGLIMESYPAQSGAAFVLRLGGGSIDDIPRQTIDELTELGWIG